MAAFSTQQRANLNDLSCNFSAKYVTSSAASLKSRQQGYRFFTEGYFHNVNMFKVADIISISAKCYRSQRKNEKPHVVHVDIKEDEITEAHCSCQAGMSAQCSHIMGLLQALQQWQLMGFTEAPSQLPCTSLPQQWGVPRGTKIEAVSAAEIDFVNPKPNRKKRPITNTLIECRKIKVQEEDVRHLQNLTDLPISYLVTCPDKKVDTHLGDVPIGSGLATHAPFYTREEGKVVGTTCGNLQFPRAPNTCLKSDDHFIDEMPIHLCQEIEQDTNKQALSPRWFDERKKRLTASIFGSIIKRKSVTEKFINSIINSKSFDSVATSYGKANEKVAISKYVTKSGNHIHECGLVVHPKFQFLAATPDGKVCDNGTTGVLEVKCPYTARDMTVEDATEKIKTFCLEELDSKLSLKLDHTYYFQVQGQLMVTGADFCDFVIYTRTGPIFIQRIFPNVVFMQELLDNLCQFYFRYIKPKI